MRMRSIGMKSENLLSNSIAVPAVMLVLKHTFIPSIIIGGESNGLACT